MEKERDKPPFNPTDGRAGCVFPGHRSSPKWQRTSRWHATSPLFQLLRLPRIDMAAITSVERGWEERECGGDTVPRHVAAKGPDVEVHAVSEVRSRRIRKNPGHDTEGDVGDIIIRTSSIRPSRPIGRGVPACIMGERAKPSLVRSRSRRGAQIHSKKIRERFVRFSTPTEGWARAVAQKGINQVLPIGRREAGPKYRV